MIMDASDARAYVQRWEAVAEVEVHEAKVATIAEKWRRLNDIRRRASRLGIAREGDDGEMEVFLLWAGLKAEYVAD